MPPALAKLGWEELVGNSRAIRGFNSNINIVHVRWVRACEPNYMQTHFCNMY